MALAKQSSRQGKAKDAISGVGEEEPTKQLRMGCRVQDIKYWNAQEKKHEEEEAAKGPRRMGKCKENDAKAVTA